MKLYKKVLLSGAMLSMLAFSVVVFAEDNTATNTAGVVPVTNSAETLKAENKAKIEAVRVEVKAKKEAKKAEAKAKRDALKQERETFALKMAQDRFVKAIAEAEAGLLATQAKLTEAKTAAAMATDRVSFEQARKLFIEARQIFDRAMRPLKKIPQIEKRDELKAPTTTNTGTNQ